jgi:hypothetical protein
VDYPLKVTALIRMALVVYAKLSFIAF